MIEMRHPLIQLAALMPWETLERELSSVLPPAPAGAGRPALPLRMIIGLLYLKHAYNHSDEQVCARWLENPYWQFFCGEVFFQTRFPCDPSSLTRFRQRLGEAGVEELLAQTIEAAKGLKAVRSADLEQIIIDSTVQEKNVAYPTDSRLLEIARHKLVKAAKAEGITLRQSYARIGPALRFKAGRYAHAKQFKRLRRTLKSQRTLLGRLIRELHRKAHADQLQRLATVLERAERLRTQKPKDKNKLYALHAPEVECIGFGLAPANPTNSASRSALPSPQRRAWSSGPAAFRATPMTATPSKSILNRPPSSPASAPRPPSSIWVIAAGSLTTSPLFTEASARPSNPRRSNCSNDDRRSNRPLAT